jgi:hypothetical protein
MVDKLRMRRVTIEPRGVLGPVHDHPDRPGTVYVLQGTVTDHRDGIHRLRTRPRRARGQHHRPPAREPGTVPAVEISVDIVIASQ